MTESKSQKITLGTKEWADSNVNIYYGCSNNCRYCYAKKMALRFKRKTEDTWKIMEPNIQQINKGYGKRKGRVMFPTSHDITEETLDQCVFVIKKLLTAGNEALITSKPHPQCIKTICETFTSFKKFIQFRFTITSYQNDLLKFWEPGAPSFEDRLNALQIAFNNGFKTSISIEPFLDKNPFQLVEKLQSYVTESIWIGKMNYIRSQGILSNERPYYNAIKEINTKMNLISILEKAREQGENIRIKDSIINYVYRK